MFLCEFSLAWDAKLNRCHIVLFDGNLPNRRRYLAIKLCYNNNSHASYQIQRYVQSGDTGVCNGNSFLELPNKCLNICHYNICLSTNKLNDIKLLLSSFSIHRKGRPNLILGIAETFLNDSWSDASLAEESHTLFRANRGDGLLVYVPAHRSISRSDPEMHGIESIGLELRYPISRPCLFPFICRPSSADISFPERMNLMLTKIDY